MVEPNLVHIGGQPLGVPAQRSLFNLDGAKQENDESQRRDAHNPKGTEKPSHGGS
jgi:hypothetical protein